MTKHKRKEEKSNGRHIWIEEVALLLEQYLSGEITKDQLLSNWGINTLIEVNIPSTEKGVNKQANEDLLGLQHVCLSIKDGLVEAPKMSKQTLVGYSAQKIKGEIYRYESKM